MSIADPSFSLFTGRRATLIVIAVSLALVFSTVSGQLMRPLWVAAGIPSLPYLYSVLASCADLLLMMILLGAAARLGPVRQLDLAGLMAAPSKALAWAVLVISPAVLIAAFATSVDPSVSALDFGWKAIGGPLFEEWVYRGLAVGALVRLCGWRWWAACLWPALFFALAHLGQGRDLAEAAGVAVVTGLGGLLFGWLYVRWDYNLWPAIFLHIGMNGLWLVFALGDTAIGGELGNALRTLTVLLALLATRRLTAVH